MTQCMTGKGSVRGRGCVLLGFAWLGGMHSGVGGHAWLGAGMTREHVYVAGGCLTGGVHGREACMGGMHAGKTATEAGGTHPTGTLSC